MTSKAWPDIERARSGKRLAGRLKGDVLPHLQVVCSANGDDERLPALASDGLGGVKNHLWICHPEKPRTQPVAVYSTADETDPEFVITPGESVKASSEVRDRSGNVVLTATPCGSLFRTSWSIRAQESHVQFLICERKRDAFWRRTFGPATKFQGGGADILGLIFLLPFLPALLKPPIRMMITDSSGANVGMVTFGAAAIRPRQSFCLYLNDEPYPIRHNALALAAISIVQRMR